MITRDPQSSGTLALLIEIEKMSEKNRKDDSELGAE
jgi:hypothetical protein